MDDPGREPDDRPRPADEAPIDSAPAGDAEPDLERIASDLADIEQALDRLGDGKYWTDEVTGEAIPDDVLATNPAARRVAYVRASEQPDRADEPPTGR